MGCGIFVFLGVYIVVLVNGRKEVIVKVGFGWKRGGLKLNWGLFFRGAF